jgi:hypothetical protein
MADFHIMHGHLDSLKCKNNHFIESLHQAKDLVSSQAVKSSSMQRSLAPRGLRWGHHARKKKNISQEALINKDNGLYEVQGTLTNNSVED